MDMQARCGLLHGVALFQGLSGDGLRTVAEAAGERRFSKEETLFRQGEPATHGVVLAAGRVRLDQVTADGRNLVLRHFGPGEMLAVVAVLREIPLPASALALDGGLALTWSASRLSKLIEAHPAIARNALEVVGGRVEELQARLQEVSVQRVEQRIAAALLRLASQSGRRTEAGIEIPFALSRQDLAEMTATTLHTVSRTLSAWDRDRVIDARRSSRLIILRPHRLAELAEHA
jgi:CRP-like cAMP-binding protein